MTVIKFRDADEQINHEEVTANVGNTAEALSIDYGQRDGVVQENNYQRVDLKEYLLMMLNAGGFLVLASIVFCMAMLISTS